MEENNIESKIKKWCAEENLIFKKIDDPASNFNIIVQFPPDKENSFLHVINNSKKPDAINIIIGGQLNSTYIEKMRQNKEKHDEIRNKLLNLLLNRPTDISLPAGELKSIRNIMQIYEDGLNKDSFMRAIRECYKTHLLIDVFFAQQFGLAGKSHSGVELYR